MFKMIRKIYKYIVDEKKQDLYVKIKYINILTRILETLWLKCSTTQFTFYNYTLTEVSLNTY